MSERPYFYFGVPKKRQPAYVRWWKKQRKIRAAKRMSFAGLTAASAIALSCTMIAISDRHPVREEGKTVTVSSRTAGASAYIGAVQTAAVEKDPSHAVGASGTVAETADDAVQREAEETREGKILAGKREELEQAKKEEADWLAAEEAREEAEAKALEEAREQAIIDAVSPNVPAEANSTIHPYMPYTAVTNTGSKQYAILHSPDAWSDPETGMRMVGDRYCIAIGQGYGITAGEKVDVVLSDGSYVKCIVGDMKADCDTDPTRKYQNTNRNVVEMVVDYAVFTKDPEQYLGLFKGLPITKLVKAE